MMSRGYNRTSSDHCVFIRKFSDDDFMILLLYVDDMLIIDHDSSKIDKLKREFSKSFAMKDLGSVKQILGLKISRDRKNRKDLERFNMSKAKAVCSPLSSQLCKTR